MERLGLLDVERYCRQMGLPGIGPEGQQRLREAHYFVLGAGGLGCPVLSYVVAAGIGHVTLAEYDTISLSNLQRQFLYRESDIGHPKGAVARERLHALDSRCHIDWISTPIDRQNASDLIRGADLIIDACDNHETRLALDHASQTLGIPLVHGAIEGFIGQVSVFNYRGSGSYTDLFVPGEERQRDPEKPSAPTPQHRSRPDVLGAIAGIIGSMLALEALKITLDLPESAAGKLLLFDGLRCRLTTLAI